MKMHLLRLGLIVALLALFEMGSHAFVVEYGNTPFPKHWALFSPAHPPNTNVLDPSTHAIRYYLASDAYSSNNATAELNAVRASMAQWEAVPGAVISFEEAGLIPPGYDVNTSDNTNVIFWVKTNTLVDNGTVDMTGVLGLTFLTTFTSDNSIAQGDIVFNGVDFQWFTDFNDVHSTNHFVESTATHELGHFLGLDHSPAGATTMFWHGLPGVDYQAGLSPDEIAAARYLYPAATNHSYYGFIGGFVALNTTNLLTITNLMQTTNFLAGTNLTGVVVTALDAHGNIAGCTVSQPNGVYLIPSLPPGNYTVQATPLDLPDAPNTLDRGVNFGITFAQAYAYMLPTPSQSASVVSGATNVVNFLVAPGIQPFTLNLFRDQTGPGLFTYTIHPGGLQMSTGETNFVVGVGGLDLPTTNITLDISGDGIQYGPTVIDTQTVPGVTLLTVPITIHDDAVPGLRTFTVTSDGFTYTAPGYLRLRSAIPDFNFDGFDDRFQRQYFALWTAPDSAPLADPDHDGFNNLAEYISGTDPTNPESYIQIDSVTETPSGALLAWSSQTNKLFQVYAKDTPDQPVWQPVGSPFLTSPKASALAVAAAGVDSPAPPSDGGFQVAFLDPVGTNSMRFYRIEAIAH